MAHMTTDGPSGPSFAETALRLGGKSEEEARRIGAVDRADEQVEALFAERHRPKTARSTGPSGTATASARTVPAAAAGRVGPVRRGDADSLEVVRRRREAGTLFGPTARSPTRRSSDLAAAGYWGLLIDPQYGGQGAPFARFAPFLTRMAIDDATVAGLASVHGCIGAVDPVRTFGTPEQKAAVPAALASGEALSGFALTEPCAGSDLTALRTTADARRRSITSSTARSCSSPTPFPAARSAWSA